MTTDEYVPSETHVREFYVGNVRDPYLPELNAQFDRFLARVRRDAAREALVQLRDHLAASRGFGVTGVEGLGYYIRDHYPEETP